MGGRGLDFYATDTFEPDLNAGVSQEYDKPVARLAIALAYLLCFPLAFWLVWKDREFSSTEKVVLTVAMVVGIALVAWRLRA